MNSIYVMAIGIYMLAAGEVAHVGINGVPTAPIEDRLTFIWLVAMGTGFAVLGEWLDRKKSADKP